MTPYARSELDRYADPWSADPLRPPETDSEPSCCELACYEDEGCACPGCDGQRSVEDRRGDADLGCGLMVIIAALAVAGAVAYAAWRIVR